MYLLGSLNFSSLLFFNVEMAELLIRFFAEILSGLSVLLTNSSIVDILNKVVREFWVLYCFVQDVYNRSKIEFVRRTERPDKISTKNLIKIQPFLHSKKEEKKNLIFHHPSAKTKYQL
jgi:hypothetical protein